MEKGSGQGKVAQKFGVTKSAAGNINNIISERKVGELQQQKEAEFA